MYAFQTTFTRQAKPNTGNQNYTVQDTVIRHNSLVQITLHNVRGLSSKTRARYSEPTKPQAIPEESSMKRGSYSLA